MENQTPTNQSEQSVLFHPEMPPRLRSLIENALRANDELSNYLITYDNYLDEARNPATYCAMQFTLLTHNGEISMGKSIRVMNRPDVVHVWKRMAEELMGSK